MSIVRIRTAIESDLMTRLPVVQPNVSIFGENADSEPPTNKPWIRMSMSVPVISYPCVNNDTEQSDGFFNVQVFTPVKKGSHMASDIVDDVRGILKSSVLNAISFLDFDASTGVQDSGWFMITVRGRFRAFN